MKILKSLQFFCAFLIAFTLGFSTSQIQAQTTFKAHLNGSSEVPSHTTKATGEITATLDGDQLTISGSFEGLSSSFTGAHIHSGMAGQNGDVSIALNAVLSADEKSGEFESENTFTLTSEQIATLETRGFYINVHSETYASGEVRGQLLPESEAYFRANLTGAFETPSVKTMANGSVVLELEGDSLFVSGSFENLDGEFDANVAGGSHLHIASAGANGDIALSLTAQLEADNKSGVYLASENAFELTSEQKTALENRLFYVNIHTTTHSAGELRGQVVPQEANAVFYATLSGAAEVPSVKSYGYGAVLLELHKDTLVVSGSYANLESSFDATIGSHIHLGSSGENGEVAIALNADVELDLKAGVYTSEENTYILTTDQVDAIYDRETYVNIHTLAYGSGELRGQIMGEANAYFRTTLSGLHEIDPVWTTASGAVDVEISGNTAIVTGSFVDLSSDFNADVAGGAHLHNGEVAANGDVAIALNTTLEEDTAGTYEAGLNTYTLTEAQLEAFYNEDMYANIHSMNYASGELRGQLLFGNNFFPDSSSITSPEEGATLNITGSATTLFQVDWTESADSNSNELNYIWQLSTDASFNDIIVNASVESNTYFSADFSVLDSLLNNLEVIIGGSTTVYHRVIVSDGSNETYGESVMNVFSRGTVTANEEPEDEPVKFGLEQNYPNPFNPSTSITFTLSETGNTSLKVYNMLGQEVATLVNSRLTEGSHTYNFDASSLSSGMYIYQLRAENQTITKRMTLIK